MYNPEIDQDVLKRINLLISNILLYCEDLDIEGVGAQIVGYLPSKRGAKIQFKNVYDLNEEYIDTWRDMAKATGATQFKCRVDMQSGHVTCSVDYIKQTWWSILFKCIVRLGFLVVAYAIWTQLHLVNKERYPLPW